MDATAIVLLYCHLQFVAVLVIAATLIYRDGQERKK
jgi:hypothetical protein